MSMSYSDMSIYFRTVSRQISPLSWWVRHAECDKFIPCRNSKPRRTVLYQFPCLTRSMTSECVFVICDMWVWYITFYEWVKRSHNNTVKWYDIVCTYKQGWHPPPDMGLCSSSGMDGDFTDRHECFLWQPSRIFSSRAVFFSTGSWVRLHNLFFGWVFSLSRVNLA